MAQQTEEASALFWMYPSTRRRIKILAATAGITMRDYLDSIVPPVPGDKDAKRK